MEDNVYTLMISSRDWNVISGVILSHCGGGNPAHLAKALRIARQAKKWRALLGFFASQEWCDECHMKSK